jgi:hypothetical protein
MIRELSYSFSDRPIPDDEYASPKQPQSGDMAECRPDTIPNVKPILQFGGATCAGEQVGLESIYLNPCPVPIFCVTITRHPKARS